MNDHDEVESDEVESAELIEARGLVAAGDALTTEQYKALEAENEEPEEYVFCSDTDDHRHSDDAWYCEHCEENHSDNEDVTEVHVDSSWRNRGRTESWCDSALERSAFNCEWTGDWFKCIEFTIVEVDGDTVCLEHNEDEIFYWDSDGEYHRDSEPEDDIPAYHDTDRNWDVPEGQGLTLGVELETYCPNPIACYEARPDGFIGERDGSLDDEHGVEFVGPPMLLADYSSEGEWAKFLERLRSNKATSWDAGNQDYGIHVSIGRAEMSRAQELAFVLLINRNKAFSEAIAGRSENRWAYYDKAHIDDATREVESNRGGEKYSATHIERGRIEVRIFRGTLAWEGFAKNVEYVHAAATYAATADLTALGVEDFTAWVFEHDTDYPHLAAFIDRKGLGTRQVALQLAA